MSSSQQHHGTASKYRGTGYRRWLSYARHIWRQYPLWMQVSAAVVTLPFVALGVFSAVYYTETTFLVGVCIPLSGHSGQVSCWHRGPGFCTTEACMGVLDQLQDKLDVVFAPQTPDEVARDHAAGITVMLMNWGRPELLRDTVLPALCSYTSVAQVIISHGLEASSWLAHAFRHPKVLHRFDYGSGGLNEQLGMWLPRPPAITACALFCFAHVIPCVRSCTRCYMCTYACYHACMWEHVAVWLFCFFCQIQLDV